MPKLSVVVPVYYNQDSLQALYEELREKVFARGDFDYELILVDDGSKDASWEIIQELARQDAKVKAVHLSRNFGSHAAILCGLSKASGDCAVVKAADLQEPTELVLSLYDKWREGYNVVLAVREGRPEKASQQLFANTYYAMVRRLALPGMPKAGFDVYLLDKKVIRVLELLDEKNSALTGQILWSGFKTAQVPYIRVERKAGKSRWTLRKKVRLVLDTLFSFTSLPISVVLTVGVLSSVVSVLWGTVLIVLRLAGVVNEIGWTSLFVFQLFSFGVTMLTLGILGEYLWRTFDAARNRPVYIVEDEINFE